MKAMLFKVGDGFFLQELSRKGIGAAVCERTLGSTWGQGDKLSINNCQEIASTGNNEWVVEIETEQEFIFDPAMGISQGHYFDKYKLDADGCIILKLI
jgi:hypothetical protein